MKYLHLSLRDTKRVVISSSKSVRRKRIWSFANTTAEEAVKTLLHEQIFKSLMVRTVEKSKLELTKVLVSNLSK